MPETLEGLLDRLDALNNCRTEDAMEIARAYPLLSSRLRAGIALAEAARVCEAMEFDGSDDGWGVAFDNLRAALSSWDSAGGEGKKCPKCGAEWLLTWTDCPYCAGRLVKLRGGKIGPMPEPGTLVGMVDDQPLTTMPEKCVACLNDKRRIIVRGGFYRCESCDMSYGRASPEPGKEKP